MTIWQRLSPYWPALTSSLIYQLGFAPFNLPLLCLVALAPWLAQLRDCDEKTAGRTGMVFGGIFAASQMWFVILLLKNWTGSYLAGIIPYLLTIGMGIAVFWAVARLIQDAWRRDWWVLIPLIWAGIESARSLIGPTAFPWGILAHPLWSQPWMVQSASFGTIYFVSAWCVLVSLLLTWWVWPPKEKKIPAGGTLFRTLFVIVTIFFFSVYRLGQEQTGVTKSITIGQPGIDLAYTRGEERQVAVETASAEVLARVRGLGGTDLLVLPEGYARGGPIPPDSPFGPSPGIPILFGASHQVGDEVRQSAFLYEPKKDLWTVHDKNRLVIFGEYVPLRGILPIDKWFNLGFMSFSPGDRVRLLTIDGSQVGAAICYEGLFSDLNATQSNMGANLLTVISIDDWYVGTPAWDQLWQASIWRSIESGLPLVRSGGLGKSLATNSRGQIIRSLEPNQQVVSKIQMKLPDSSDANPWRMVFVWLCWAVCAGQFGLILFEKWKGKPTSDDMHSDVKIK